KNPSIEEGPLRHGRSAARRWAEAIDVRVDHEEAPDVLQADEEIFLRLRDAVRREPQARPRVHLAEETPPQRVGPVRVEHDFRLEVILLRFRHLVPLLVADVTRDETGPERTGVPLICL